MTGFWQWMDNHSLIAFFALLAVLWAVVEIVRAIANRRKLF